MPYCLALKKQDMWLKGVFGYTASSSTYVCMYVCMYVHSKAICQENFCLKEIHKKKNKKHFFKLLILKAGGILKASLARKN